jgi:hypothetical protein
MHQLTDKALLIAEDEQEAFRLLYDRYWQALYLKALYRIGNDADAQDLVQEVFIGLWRNKNNILSQDSPYYHRILFLPIFLLHLNMVLLSGFTGRLKKGS